MNSRSPARAHLLLHRTPSELEPGSVEEVVRFVTAGTPDHHRRGIGRDAKPLLAFAQGVFDPSASDTLNQQPGNQARLPQERSGRADNVEFVLIPQRWFAKPDEASSR